MRVLKKGRKQRGWAIEMLCSGNGHGGGGCGATLLVEEDDIYETGSGGDGPDYARTFVCPECRVETNLPSEAVPVQVWDRSSARRDPIRRIADRED